MYGYAKQPSNCKCDDCTYGRDSSRCRCTDYTNARITFTCLCRTCKSFDFNSGEDCCDGAVVDGIGEVPRGVYYYR